MRSWRSSKTSKPDEAPEPASAPADAGAPVKTRTGLYSRSKVRAHELRPIKIRTVQLALVPIAVGVLLLVVVPAVVVDLTPRESPTDGAAPPPTPERIDPDAGEFHRPEAPNPTRKPGGILNSQEPLPERIAAARELGRNGSAQALRVLLEAAGSHDADTRRAAAMGLVRRLSDPRAQDALWTLLGDDDTAVAKTTAAALGAVEGSAPLLVGRLDAPDTSSGKDVHEACLRALPYAGNPQCVPSLMRFVETDTALGQVATETVWKICQRTRTPLPPDFPDWRPRR